MADIMDKTVNPLSDTLTHKDLEKEDVRLEGKIDRIIVSISGENGINKTLDRIESQTIQHNGRLKKVEWRNAMIIGGAVVLMFLLSFFRDNLIEITAQAVVKQLTENSQKYDIIIND